MAGIIYGRVADSGGSGGPVVNARVSLHSQSPCSDENLLHSVLTDEEGSFEFTELEERTYHVHCSAFSMNAQPEQRSVGHDKKECVDLAVALDLSITLQAFTGQGDAREPCSHAIAGRRFLVSANASRAEKQILDYKFIAYPDGAVLRTSAANEAEITFLEPGAKRIEVRARDQNKHSDSRRGTYAISSVATYASESDRQTIGGNLGVRLERTSAPPTRDQALWIAIRNRTAAIGFTRYQDFMNRVWQAEEREKLGNAELERRLKDLSTHLHGAGAYQVLKIATEAFLLLECGVRIEEDRAEQPRFLHPESESARVSEPVSFDYARAKLQEYLGSPPQLPYITRVIETAFPEWRAGVASDRVLTGKVNEPCLIELIWSYWLEEGMLTQTMNAVTRRFQNLRGSGDRDPIAHLELDPLRPIDNLLWGFIQDETHRLSVKRRAYEYEHQYGLSLYGKAVRELRPADSRSQFLEGFRNLLHLCSVFFKEDDDTTVVADGCPVLHALKDVHLLLAQGAHNQFGDLPWTARAEMMLQQWMLARQEIRDFLQSRVLVPYREAWMPQVDTMNTLQGWSGVSVTHFHDLAVYGEQILLSVRYGDWIAINDENAAKNWVRYWRPELQGYIHAHRAATGIDLIDRKNKNSSQKEERIEGAS